MEIRPIADDEIDADEYVIKPELHTGKYTGTVWAAEIE
jgi:hypothetical protein